MLAIFALIGIAAAGYPPQNYYNAAPQLQQYQPAPPGSYVPPAPQPAQYPQDNRVLAGYLLTPIPAPPEYINAPADIPPMKEGSYIKMGSGGDNTPLYVIQHPDTTGQAPVLPPGYSASPHEEGQRPSGFFMPVGNAPTQNGQPFTLMVVNGMRTHGPSYNALPVQPEVNVKTDLVAYQPPPYSAKYYL